MGHLLEKVGVTGLMVRLARNPGGYHVCSVISERCYIKNDINSQRSLFRPALLKKLCEYVLSAWVYAKVLASNLIAR